MTSDKKKMIKRKCPKCKLEKELTEFYKAKRKDNRHGVVCYCKECMKKLRRAYLNTEQGKIKTREWQRQYAKKYPERTRLYGRRSEYKNTYGISLEEYEKMEKEQNRVCYICGKPEIYRKKLSIDHNHHTGKVRKLLCVRCNTTLGWVNEDIELLRKMIAYIEAGDV